MHTNEPVEKIVSSELISLDRLSEKLNQHFMLHLILELFGRNSTTKKWHLASWLQSTEKAIVQNTNPVREAFHANHMRIAQDYTEDFKNKIFGSILLSLADTHSNDPEFALIKKNFILADREELTNTIFHILEESHKYVSDIGSALKYRDITSPKQFEFNFLNCPSMSLKGVID